MHDWDNATNPPSGIAANRGERDQNSKQRAHARCRHTCLVRGGCVGRMTAVVVGRDAEL